MHPPLSQPFYCCRISKSNTSTRYWLCLCWETCSKYVSFLLTDPFSCALYRKGIILKQQQLQFLSDRNCIANFNSLCQSQAAAFLVTWFQCLNVCVGFIPTVAKTRVANTESFYFSSKKETRNSAVTESYHLCIMFSPQNNSHIISAIFHCLR